MSHGDGQQECSGEGHESIEERFDQVAADLAIELSDRERAFLLDTRQHFGIDAIVRTRGVENCQIPEGFRTLREVIGDTDTRRFYAGTSSEESEHRRSEKNREHHLALVQQGFVDLLDFPLLDPSPFYLKMQQVLRRVTNAPINPDRLNEYHTLLDKFTGSCQVKPAISGLLADVLEDLCAGDIAKATRHRDLIVHEVRHWRDELNIAVAHPDDICSLLLKTKHEAVELLLRAAESAAERKEDPAVHLGNAVKVLDFEYIPAFHKGVQTSVREPKNYAPQIKDRVLSIQDAYSTGRGYP